MNEEQLIKFLFSIAQHSLGFHRRDIREYFQLTEAELEELDAMLELKAEAGELI